MSYIEDNDLDTEYQLELLQAYEHLKSFSDKEIKSKVNALLKHKNYIPNDFTDMIRSIVGHDNLSSKQRRVLMLHIVNNIEVFTL